MSIRLTPSGLVKDTDEPEHARPGTEAGRKLHADYCGCSTKRGDCSLMRLVRQVEQEACDGE